MATFGGAWHNAYTVLQTTLGTFRATYHPRKDGSTNSERVLIAGPGDEVRKVHTPSLGSFALTAENGELCVWWLQTGTLVERREATGIPCGEPVAAHTFGGVGPLGPTGGVGPKGDQGDPGPQGPRGEDGEDAVALTQQEIDAIAERVFTLPPAPDHFGLPEYVRYGTRFQEMIAVMVHQALAQHVIMATDEGAANLVASGYQPKITT